MGPRQNHPNPQEVRQDNIGVAGEMNPQPKKKRIRLKGKEYTEFKIELYNRSNESCETCGRWLPLTNALGRFDEYTCAHVSHIIPVSRGGEDTFKNCKIECFKCHRRKHDGL